MWTFAFCTPYLTLLEHARTLTGCCKRVSLRNATTRNGTRSQSDGPGTLWTEPTHNGRTAVTGHQQRAHGDGETLGGVFQVSGEVCWSCCVTLSDEPAPTWRSAGYSCLIHVTQREDIYILGFLLQAKCNCWIDFMGCGSLPRTPVQTSPPTPTENRANRACFSGEASLLFWTNLDLNCFYSPIINVIVSF